MIVERGRPEFGILLRRFRLEAGLSQKALAERARIGLETVSALERGYRRAPYRGTVDRLATALKLSPADRLKLEAAAASEQRPRSIAPPSLARVHVLPTADSAPSNVPLAATPLVGRDAVVAELVDLIRVARLVTLAGTGGVGKTRIAMQVATVVRNDFTDGVCFIDLSQIAPGAMVAGAVAAALGAQPAGNQPAIEALCASLMRGRVLLILDCCEHVVAGAAALAAAVLRACPAVRMIATSREVLRTAGEHVYHVDPLDVPTGEEPATAADAFNFGAVALFVERARAIDSGFRVGDAEAKLIVDICRQVEGIPLAIELAAARVKQLGLETLIRRVEKQLSVLTGGARTAPARHRTMRALLDWSYDLLTEAERALMRRAAIFSGGWTLDAAEHVCVGESHAASDVLDLLLELTNKSLVVVEPSAGGVRYRMLDAAREYALEKLEASGELSAVACRQARWMAAFADRTDLEGWNEPIGRWLPPMAAELNNARAALRWALGPGDEPQTAGLVAAGFGRWGFSCGLIDEARAWIESALEKLRHPGDSAIAARLWLALATLTSGARRVEVCERARAIFRSAGDIRRLAVSCVRLGGGYCQIAEYDRAAVTLQESLALLRQCGYSRSAYYGIALSWQGTALAALDRRDEARGLLLESVMIFEALGDYDRAANERVNLAELEFAAGDTARALEIVSSAIEVLRSGAGFDGFRLADSFQVVALQNTAAYSLILGDTDRARAAARAALVQARGARGADWRVITIAHLAAVAALRGQTAVAAQLCGYVDEALRVNGFHRDLTEQRTHEILLAAIHSELNERERTRLIAYGAALTEDQAVEMALAIG